VVVIGGGDTGTDCVGTSLRHGCRSLVQFEILPRPPTSAPPTTPGRNGPKVYKLDYGQEEAAAIYGQDPRQYCITDQALCRRRERHVKEVHTVQVEWVAGERPLQPARNPRHGKGLAGPTGAAGDGLPGPGETAAGQLGVERDERGNATGRVRGKFATSVPGVFAAGDMRRGQSLVVWAINEGRGAAREVRPVPDGAEYSSCSVKVNMEFSDQFERDFMRRTLKLVQDYQGPYDATLLLNCLLGLLIVPKERSIDRIPADPVADLHKWGISPNSIKSFGSDRGGQVHA
jgi:hypothetical protein